MKKIVAAALLMVTSIMPLHAETLTKVLADPDRSIADQKRDARSRPDVVIELLGIGEGDRVADIFAGGGYYSELLGSVVSPGGDVLLHNNKAYLGFAAKALDARFAKGAPPGVTRHDREVDDLDLGEGNLDAAMIIMSYHDLYHSSEGWPTIDVADFMGQIVKALKPGGRFLIVDHQGAVGTGSSAAQDLHRIDEAFARKDVESYGLKYVASSDVLRNPDDDFSLSPFDPKVRGITDRFILVFEKP
ncbi:MAG: class I SAM-dependent methyltransferase [Halieaceae bacterium]|jgi:predicted methyltransferase|nr:class I SAM-dependent methyltransferase [Halieaceae bacterium]